MATLEIWARQQSQKVCNDISAKLKDKTVTQVIVSYTGCSHVDYVIPWGVLIKWLPKFGHARKDYKKKLLKLVVEELEPKMLNKKVLAVSIRVQGVNYTGIDTSTTCLHLRPGPTPVKVWGPTHGLMTEKVTPTHASSTWTGTYLRFVDMESSDTDSDSIGLTSSEDDEEDQPKKSVYRALFIQDKSVNMDDID